MSEQGQDNVCGNVKEWGLCREAVEVKGMTLGLIFLRESGMAFVMMRPVARGLRRASHGVGFFVWKVRGD